MTADNENDPTEEREDGATPNGGASSVIYYRDAEGNPCPKSKAVAAEVHELDATGGSVFRTLLKVRP